MAVTCSMCGTSNADGVQFCAACGTPLSGGAPAVARPAQTDGSMPAKTMLFGRAPQIPEAQAKPSPVKPVQVQPVAHQPAALAPAEPGFASNRTMLGAPPVNLNETARPAAGVPMIRDRTRGVRVRPGSD